MTLSTSFSAESQKKLSLIRESILKKNGANGAGGSLSKLTSELLPLVDVLFHRAPPAFVEQTDIDDLISIAAHANNALHEFSGQDQLCYTTFHEIARSQGRRKRTAMISVMDDRPFIVDTLIEQLRVSELRHYVLLHPILRHADGRKTSLTYLELEHVGDTSLLEDLRSKLTARFSDLRIICDDFSKMLGKIDTALSLVSFSGGSDGTVSNSERKEVADFLRWLADGGFVFLGSKEWEQTSTERTISAVPQSELGLFRSSHDNVLQELNDVALDAELSLTSPESVVRVAKIYPTSPVHRFVRMDLVSVRLPSERGTTRTLIFVGLFTSRAAAQEASSVPLIRQRLKRVFEIEGLLPNSHDHKESISIANSLSKSELLQFDEETLRRCLGLMSGIQRRLDIKVHYHLDSLRRFVSVLVAMPRERFSASARFEIQEHLAAILQSSESSSEYHVPVSDLAIVIVHYLIPNPSRQAVELNVPELEQHILGLTLTWEDHLIAALSGQGEGRAWRKLAEHYGDAFPEHYKAVTHAEAALHDVQMLESLSEHSPLEASLQHGPKEKGEQLYYLTLYKQGAALTLSATLPFLENMGFSILDELVTPVITNAGATTAIYKLLVRPKTTIAIDIERANQILLPGLKMVLNGKAENDRLNELLLNPGLSYPDIAILRTLSHYLWQIKASTSDQAINAALVENPTVSKILVDFFRVKFDPLLFTGSQQSRTDELELLRERFLNELKNVSQLAFDRTLRRLLNVIDACVRTNFYRHIDDYRIALKIDCSKIERMPIPRPYFEIFVNAPDFQGVHLRGGRVARGGIRWSDRNDDYRTEVLGLMKTQMVKNAIIIPVGAKGGFVLRNRPQDPNELSAAVRECYSRFVRSLLEVTDNLVDDKVVHPPHCIIYDGEDPYFVVAADRGTATFSDLANSIAVNEFHFWLGDAFASGGSNGYDHKKLGITARGAWEAVCRHFRETGIDYEQQEFTAVGIGDMSGDVFGNGLLLSQKVKLIAAFNHKHIFIDPNPNPQASFNERARLFQLPRSQWSDYRPELISPGGGVFERTQKEISLSPEAQHALGINTPVIAGQELVRAVLRAPVDLLWNGGIGTYVKSVEEDDLAVGDRANDDVRVDARDLRVKVVGEGGNLGFTQRARIEYSKIGGHINTDAIDNSGGVNMSDLEVNLKILLRAPVVRGELSLDERNKLLTSLAEQVSEKVVNRNRAQSKVLSLGVRRSRKNLGYYRGQISALEQARLLDRKAEYLPDDETLERRMQMKAGLTRPELAVLLGYTKMSLFNQLIESELPDNSFCERFLLGYFPKELVERFRSDILKHPLRREIIATELANIVVDRMGTSFIFRTQEETGAKLDLIIRAFLVADSILDGDRLVRSLRSIDRTSSTRLHHTMFMRLSAAIDGMSRWFLEHPHISFRIEQIVERYQTPFKELVLQTDAVVLQSERNRFREACKQLIVSGVPRELSTTIASLIYSTAYLDIIEVAVGAQAPVLDVAKLFAQLYVRLHISQLLEKVGDMEPSDRWEASAIRALSGDVRRSVAKAALSVIQKHGESGLREPIDVFADHADILARYEASYQELSTKPLTVPGLLVLTNQLFALSRNSS